MNDSHTTREEKSLADMLMLNKVERAGLELLEVIDDCRALSPNLQARAANAMHEFLRTIDLGRTRPHLAGGPLDTLLRGAHRNEPAQERQP